MLPLRRRQLRVEHGTNMVEFALAGGVLLLLVFGILDFGRAISQYNLISNSAREGARMAIITSNTDTQVRNRVVSSSANIIPSSGVTMCSTTGSSCTPTWPPSGTRSCTTLPCGKVTVAVSVTFAPVTPLIRTFTGNSFVLTTSSTMVMER